MSRSVWVLASVAAIAASSVGPAQSAVVTYRFAGAVSSTQNIDAVPIGTAFNATLTYDTEKASGTDYDVQQDYTFATGGYHFAVSLTLDPDTTPTFAGSSSGGQVSILNNFSGPPPQDWFQTRSAIVDGWTGDAIGGLTWRQSDITLKNLDGTLYSSTVLPDSIASLNNFGEAFASLYLTPVGGPSTFINANITSIEAVLSTLAQTTLVAGTQTAVLPSADAGGLQVTAPVEGDFSATYSQQAADEVDLGSFNFFIPGSIFQLWDLSFSGDLASGNFVEMVFRYDDSGMTYFQELLLDIFHDVGGGSYERLFGVVDPVANTITARTYSFSDFVLGQAQPSAVPEPTTAWLTMLALGALVLQWQRRESAGRRSAG